MPDFSRWGASGGDPSLNAIARTDRYLDALASEQPVYATDPADAELANLMSGWRDDVRRPPARVASQRDAEIVLQRAVAARRRSRMSMAVTGSVAAALLCLGGFGAVVYGAGPGDALYGLRVSLFGEQQVTRDDQVALAAQTEMQQVQQLIDKGDWTAAQDKLETITSTVQTVEDPQRQEELQQQLNQLTVKVESRDPAATVPESAPIEPLPAAPPPAGESPGPLPLPLPGSPLPLPLPGGPDLPLPLPGPGVPPDVSFPPLPSFPLPKPLPKPLPDDSKPPADDSKPPADNDKPPADDSKPPADDSKPPVDQPDPESPKPVPKPIPVEPKAEPPKPAEPPKQLAPEPAPAPKTPPAPKPAPEPESPAPVPEPPPVPMTPVIPAPKVPAVAPPQELPPVQITTTIPLVPAEKPKRGD